MGGESRRFRAFILAAILPVAAAAQQPQKLRDRDPDLAASKKLASDLQQANFHAGPFYLMSRLRLSDAGFSGATAVPTGGDGGGLSISVDAPQRLYFVPTKKVILSAEFIPGYTFFRANDRDVSRNGDRSGQFNYLARGDA
ncbi:MAG TPA: hypothetical protein VHK90_03765, partial [Thermoanaerobaculia bacterium]|nr:hypothetical protein [Thermoanaerobaculia bacterium]